MTVLPMDRLPISRIRDEHLTHALDWMLLRRKVREIETGVRQDRNMAELIDEYIRAHPESLEGGSNSNT